jgi:tetratricopeptide (TPR) repeat protein
MKKAALAAALLLAAVVPLRAETASSPQMVAFVGRDRGVRIFFPEGWHVMENKDRHPYLVTIEPTAPSSEPKAVPLTIEFLKFYRISANPMGRGTPEQILDRYVQSILDVGKAEVIRQEPRDVQGNPGRLVEIKAVDPRGTMPLRVYILAAVNRDVLGALICQAPETEIELYKGLFDDILSKVEPFSVDATLPDVTMLDNESRKIEADALVALQSGDLRGMVALFERAIRINPGRVSHRVAYAGTLMRLAINPNGELQGDVIMKAQRELTIARSMLDLQTDPSSAELLAQVLFLEGEIAYYAQGDKARAKTFYEKALRTAPNEGAREALKRYEGS